MKIIILLISLLMLTFLLLGCGAQEVVEDHDDLDTQDDDVIVKEKVVKEPKEVAAPEPTVKAFSIIARQWEFEPSTITVNKGDTVQLTLTSVDVSHGYSISAFGVNEILKPGATVETSFVADKVGTFTSTCSVSCGEGHLAMTGTIVVLE